jgi:putative sigma-54 modulation protein
MKVTYTGIKQDLSKKLQGKLDAKFAKLSKLLEKRGELEAHVVVKPVRHLHKVEITIPFYEHQLVGLGSDADLFTALTEALEKLETQALKNRGKWREKHRRADGLPPEAPALEPARSKNGSKAAAESAGTVNVFRVNHHDQRKPMTVDEALMEMEEDRDYVVYRDADKEKVSVLVRRRDGHFDLIEG